MPNTVQLTQNGQPVYPVTDVSLITGLEERSGMRVIPYTTRPTASAETAGFIYMDESTLDLYVTKATSGSYSWVSAGNLSNIDLDDYATKTELEQLGQKVDDISTGKYYGYFAQEEDLPEADVDGFAYVGEGPTYTIYNCVGGVWTSSDITVNQSPIGNDEDIDQNEDGKLQFANRVYNAQQPNGMGYKILRKDATFAEQVTDTNTIYEIRYDYDLDGETVTVPAGCALKFVGGSVNNGTIDFNGSVVDSPKPCFSGVTPVALYRIEVVWFGVVPGAGQSIGATLNALVASINYKTTLVFERQDYYTTTTITINGDFNIIGFPTFVTSQENTKCISIVGCHESTLQFNVRKTTKALWKDNGSIGVELVGLTKCTVQIDKIQYFTYGVQMIARSRVSNGGFAWNNLYISNIIAALQSIVIISEGGWPNANNVFGTGFYRYGGQWDATGATEPIRYIVFKNDGNYGMSGWRFYGLWFENTAANSPTIGGKPFANIDLQTYVTQNQGQYVSTYNLVFDGRWESTKNMVLVNSNYVFHHSIILIGMNTTVGNYNPIAVDQNGCSVIGSLVDIYGEPAYEKHLISVCNPDVQDLSGMYRISPDGRVCGLGIYETLTRYFGAYGNDAKCILLENPAGYRLKISITKGATLRVCAIDDSLQKLTVEDHLYSVGYPGTRLNTNTTYKWYHRTSTKDDTYYIVVLPTSTCKYVALAVLDGRMDVYKLTDKSDNTPTKFAYPFGEYDGLIKTEAWGNLRAVVHDGQRIYDGSRLYHILTNGSVGNIGSVTATGTTGQTTVTVSSASNLYVGDYITIDSVDYEVKVRSETTLTLNKALETSPNASAVSLVAPKYFVTFLSSYQGTTIKRPNFQPLDDDDIGYPYYDTDLMRPLYMSYAMQQELQMTASRNEGDRSSPARESHSNALQPNLRYWIGYSQKQSWGGKVSFRKTASVESTDADEIIILSNFNSADKGTWFTSPDPSVYPYIFTSNSYTVAETLTIERAIPYWIEQDGAKAGVLRQGITADRPVPADIYVGFTYFDTTIGKMIVWNGSAWVNMDGTALS